MLRRNTILIAVLLLQCLTTALVGQSDLSLQQAIAIALDNSYGIKISDRQILIAQSNDSWARAGRVPTVDLVGSFNNNFIQDNNPASFLRGTFYTGNLGLTANTSMLVYGGGRVKISKDQLSANVQQQLAAQEGTINDLIRAVSQQYYDVILQQEQLLVLQQVFDLSKDRLAYEEVRREFGVSNSYNIVQFQNTVVTDSINVITQQQRVEIAMLTLYNTLELDASNERVPTDKLSVEPEPIDYEAMRSELVASNPTIKTLAIASTLADLNTKLADAIRKPQVSIFANFGFQENGFQFYGAETGMGPPPGLLLSNRASINAGAQASWSVYDGGVLNQDVQNAQVQKDIADIQIEQAQADLISQLDVLVSNYDQQRVLLDLTEQQITLAQESLDISDERFEGGQITSLDYRNAQLQYLNAAFARVSAIYQLQQTKIDIDWLMGRYGEG